MDSNKTKVRYAVRYNDRNYEYALHSRKRHFVRNMADIVNILEYCISQDLKQGLYDDDERLYNFNVARLVNDTNDGTFDDGRFKGAINTLVGQMVVDAKQRDA